MAKYPNQRTVKIDKINSTNYFAMYGRPEIENACKVLNGSGFKVYCYIFSNRNRFTLDISPAHAERCWGIHQSTFADGINELIEKGFISDGIAHQTSIKEQSEYRETNPNIGLNSSENGWSNNIYNNKDINTEVLNTGVENFKKPIDENEQINNNVFIF